MYVLCTNAPTRGHPPLNAPSVVRLFLSHSRETLTLPVPHILMCTQDTHDDDFQLRAYIHCRLQGRLLMLLQFETGFVEVVFIYTRVYIVARCSGLATRAK